MKWFLVFSLNIVIIGLFLLTKLLPFRDRLSPKYQAMIDFFNNILTPILNFLRRFLKPIQVGQGLSLDITQIALLILFLTILNML